VYFNIGGGSKLPGSSIDTTDNRLARYSVLWVNVELLHVINYEINVFTLLQVGCNLPAADQGWMVHLHHTCQG
jgi:hypothetical protein